MSMEDAFFIYDANGSHLSTAYSSVAFGTAAEVTYGFPGLAYKETTSIKSDPEVTVYHDPIKISGDDDGGSGSPILLSGIAAAVMVAIIGSVLVWMKRRKG